MQNFWYYKSVYNVKNQQQKSEFCTECQIQTYCADGWPSSQQKKDVKRHPIPSIKTIKPKGSTVNLSWSVLKFSSGWKVVHSKNRRVSFAESYRMIWWEITETAVLVRIFLFSQTMFWNFNLNSLWRRACSANYNFKSWLSVTISI